MNRLAAADELLLVASGHHDGDAHDLDVERIPARPLRPARIVGSVMRSSESLLFTGCYRRAVGHFAGDLGHPWPDPAQEHRRRAALQRPGSNAGTIRVCV